MTDSGAGSGPDEGPFRYHLELTPSQLKITHTALHSMLNDMGHDEADVLAIVQEVLAKLPDEHAIRAIRLQGETVEDTPQGEPERIQPEPDGGEPPDSVA